MSKDSINAKSIKTEFLEYLEPLYSAERAKKEAEYLYSENKHYGTTAAQNRIYFKHIKPKLKNLSKQEIVNISAELWESDIHEVKMLALSILGLKTSELTIKDIPLIEKMMRESRGWVYLDNLIIPLMPNILEKNPKAYEYLRKWIKDDDFWVRRSALVAQVLFFRKNVGGDKELFFELAKSQFDEAWIDKIYTDNLQRKRAKFFIRKAIGWTIREISIKDPKTAYSFLKQNKNKMSGLSFRDGSRKLPKDLLENL